MAAVVRAVESVVRLPAYREDVLAYAPPIARHDPGEVRGVFLGYDFHVARGRFALIEINTNAGGALLNTLLARAQRGCCLGFGVRSPSPRTARGFERRIVAMFREEWARAGRRRALARVAIVDDAPADQYLYPEFLLFEALFRRHGISAVVADPAELELGDDLVLRHEGAAIDLVYNRSTDFALTAPSSASLAAAYLADAVVLTPHPRAHALYADKRNLALLGDPDRLEAIGVPPKTRALLHDAIPRTEPLHTGNAERLRAARRGLFFKPHAGHGSRGAWRGDKLTRRVWNDIAAGGHVAQVTVAPGTRRTSPAPEAKPLKYDVRTYAYGDTVQWTAARLYRGQTTNFRTPGGGFAPVHMLGTRFGGTRSG